MQINRREQFKSIIETYDKALWRVVLIFESDSVEQDDLYQDILLAIWKSLAAFQGKSHLKTYVYRVAYNTAFSYIQKQSKKALASNSDIDIICQAGTPAQLYSAQQQSQLLTNAIRQLPIGQRQFIALSLEGLTYPEIGEIMGMTANAVGVSLSRARLKLKQLMENANG
jgi:RNA polymerase sigma factor (sigma-70 family)